MESLGGQGQGHADRLPRRSEAAEMLPDAKELSVIAPESLEDSVSV